MTRGRLVRAVAAWAGSGRGVRVGSALCRRSMAMALMIGVAVVATTGVGATSPDAAPDSGASPVLTVLPVATAGAASPETATLLGDIVYSAVLAIPNLRVVQGDATVHAGGGAAHHGDATTHADGAAPRPGDGARPGEYLLESVLWDDHGYHLVLTLHDIRRRSVVDSTILAVTADGGVTTGIERWRDDMRILFATLRDDRLVRQTEFLLDEGNISLAWTYYLAATVRGHPVPAATERAIREERADRLREELSPVRFLRRGTLPPDASERITEIILVSPETGDDELLRRLAEEREDLFRHRMEILDAQVGELLRKDDTAAARTLLAGDEAQDLAERDPRAIRALEEAVRLREREIRIARSRALLRRDDRRGSAEPLEAILSAGTIGGSTGRAPAPAAPSRAVPSTAAPVVEPPVIDALVHREETLIARDRRSIRREQIPDPLEARSVGERWIWSSLGGTGTEDPLERYYDGGVHLSYGIGIATAAPLLPYLRLHRGIGAYLRPAQRPASDLTRIDLLGHLTPAIGTNLLELAVGITGGVSVLTGSRETVTETDLTGNPTTTDSGPTTTDRPVLQVGPALGITGEAAILVPGRRLRIALHLTRRHTLWIPDLYLTPATTVGVRIGWIW
ncbi:MAG: hypothetical protein ACLFSV_07345 [Alkalispirochaeta sp.]